MILLNSGGVENNEMAKSFDMPSLESLISAVTDVMNESVSESIQCRVVVIQLDLRQNAYLNSD